MQPLKPVQHHSIYCNISFLYHWDDNSPTYHKVHDRSRKQLIFSHYHNSTQYKVSRDREALPNVYNMSRVREGNHNGFLLSNKPPSSFVSH